MSIEQEIFASYLIVEEKLAGYGFCPDGDKLVYVKTLPKGDFKVILEYDGTITGKMIDLAINEEYTNFRIRNASGFRAEVKQQYTELLLDIREKCCRNAYFKSGQARRINDYIYGTYNGVPEFLWPNIPSYGAYRLKDGKKWYAVIGSVPLYKIDHTADSAKEVEVINVKADKDKVGGLLSQTGFYPAFHMNKKCWVSIILDDTLADGEIQKLIDGSYKSL